MTGRLEGRSCIVTGGAHGIGRAYCEGLGAEGARVMVADLDGDEAHRVADRLRREGMDASSCLVDVSDSAQCEAMAAATVRAFGRIDALVANAAIFATVPMSRSGFDVIEESEWDRMLAVNLKGVWLCAKAVVPSMRAQQSGKIVTIGSGTMLSGDATRIHYISSKSALIGFTRTLARELGQDGITVNMVVPGSTLSEENPTDEVMELRTLGAVGRAIPRVQRPDDLVGPVLFLLSDDSAFITGQLLNVDGGKNMY